MNNCDLIFETPLTSIPVYNVVHNNVPTHIPVFTCEYFLIICLQLIQVKTA